MRSSKSKKYYPDWDCLQCGKQKIFGSKDKCPGCGGFRSKGVPSGKGSVFDKESEDMSERLANHDWDCPCGRTVIFGSRSKCGSCDGHRSAGWPTGSKPNNNNSNNDNEEIDGKEIEKKEYVKKPGDWDCVCGCSNFRSRLACFKCGTPRVNNISAPSVPNNMDSDDSKLCKICMERPLEILIKTCTHICMCSECAYSIKPSNCPICRAAFIPESDLIKVIIS